MFSSLLNNEKRHKHECIVYPASKLMGHVLRVMQKYGYVGEFLLAASIFTQNTYPRRWPPFSASRASL